MMQPSGGDYRRTGGVFYSPSLSGRRGRRNGGWRAIAVAVLAAGCVPQNTQPTTMFAPRPNQDPQEFQNDDMECRQTGRVQANTHGLTQGTTATLQSLQQAFDDAYTACMSGKGYVPAGAPAAPQPAAPMQPAPAPATPRAAPAAPVSDPLVASIQTELIRLRFLSGPADGVLGPRTRAAISKFQETSGMPADGKPSQALLDTLRKN
jgi:hypothetical protein